MNNVQYDSIETKMELPTSYEVYDRFRWELRVWYYYSGKITKAQYKNALGQFKHGDYNSCYGFINHIDPDNTIIEDIEKYKSAPRPVLHAIVKVTFPTSVAIGVYEINPKGKDE